VKPSTAAKNDDFVIVIASVRSATVYEPLSEAGRLGNRVVVMRQFILSRLGKPISAAVAALITAAGDRRMGRLNHIRDACRSNRIPLRDQR
jgi:hypothetical protein